MALCEPLKCKYPGNQQVLLNSGYAEIFCPRTLKKCLRVKLNHSDVSNPGTQQIPAVISPSLNDGRVSQIPQICIWGMKLSPLLKRFHGQILAPSVLPHPGTEHSVSPYAAWGHGACWRAGWAGQEALQAGLGAPGRYLLADGCPPAALGLLVGLGESPVAGPNALAGCIVDFPAYSIPRSVAHGWRKRQLFHSQERLELCKEFWKFPSKMKINCKLAPLGPSESGLEIRAASRGH